MADLFGVPLDDAFEMVEITDADRQEADQELQQHGAGGLKDFLLRKMNQWKDVPLNIAITGTSGCGKSTFINTMRGLSADDPGAAKVGVTECTIEPTAYPHPEHKSFTLWDLPGVGTPNFPQEGYMEKVNFNKFDFFFIMSSRRFTENDMWLGQEVDRRGKRFFFIRTRIDEDMRNDKDDHPQTHDEDTVLSEIKQNCNANLDEAKIHAHVFLISGKKRYETCWDFPALNETLIKSIPALKRHAMVLSLTVNSKEIIQEKCNALATRIWIVAGASAAIAVVPVPGLSIAADIALLVNEVSTYKQQLGLDDESLRKVSIVYGVPLEQINVSIGAMMPGASIRELQKWIMQLLAEFAVTTAAEEFARFIPILGSVVAAGISFTTTVLVLKRVLAQLREAALKVLEVTVENSKADI